ncbi:MAG: VIT and VWA domain-containing protein [Candidatus Pacebacteria bacterium]|nr:VIT and VWA domain-containing protein [Candidatus Paceibacterota bacterium]
MKIMIHVCLGVAAAVMSLSAFGAGTLVPAQSGLQPMQITDHAVEVVINNGFAKTTVTQTFHNPNGQDLEALYAFPLPKSGSLSEVTATLGEKVINGEVLPKDKAKAVYEEERDSGNEAGLASQDSYKRFEFALSPVRAHGTALITFVYYQPLAIDTGVGRYVYPLEEGGTDDPAAMSFWTRNETVAGRITVDVELKSAWPVTDVRTPGFEGLSTIKQLEHDGHYQIHMERDGGVLNKDFVFYYRLADNLPGRVEVIPYKPASDKPGTFMLVVTPGLDLKPLDNGADYVFVLDTSGSMAGKLHALTEGVTKVLGKMRPQDRFRIVTFESRAHLLVGSWQAATAENVQRAIGKVQVLQASGSTNLHDGLRGALSNLDGDRATSIILVTDGVTNTGVIAPRAFHKLMKEHDVRVFGFLMGNSSNWPLMRVICDASGGFYASVSNNDDILGRILQAKGKVLHECLHDASLRIRGVKAYGTTDGYIGKVYRGQQLVFFGRYDKGGDATVELKARLTGDDKVYSTTFTFPTVDTDNPELERLWALHRVEALELRRDAGLEDASEVEAAVRDLGVNYQIVTNETSMVMLTGDAFARRGIQRRNQERIAREHKAQAVRSSQPVKNYRVDKTKSAFRHSAPSIGNGGGAFGPVSGLISVCLGLAGIMGGHRAGRRSQHGRAAFSRRS